MDKQKYYQEAVTFIKQEKYKQALDNLDILLLKDQKNIEYNMMSGLCFQKQLNYKKAEEFYLYCLEKRPEDPKIINALFKLYKDDIKLTEKAIEFGKKLITIYMKTDKIKAMEATVGYCEILHQNQERKQLDFHFQELIKYGTAEQLCKVAKFYIPLLLDLKLLDATKPKQHDQLKKFSEKIQNQPPNFEVQELIARKAVSKFPNEFRDLIFGMAISEEHYTALFDWLELLPSSCFLLDQVLRYCHCFLDFRIKFLLEQCILLLSDNQDSQLFKNYQIFDEEQYAKTIMKAQSFLAFMKKYASQVVQQCGDQFLEVMEKLIRQKNFDILEKEKDYTILELPLKVSQIHGQIDNQQIASTLLKEFNRKMNQLKNLDYNVPVLEEVGANLSLDILDDPVELMEMKNLLKIRIKNKAFSLETYSKYLDYQMKLVALIKHYDEELPMEMIFDKILQDDPKNIKAQINFDWLKFSENKITQQELLQRYQSYENVPPQIQQVILKRMGTIKLMNKDLNGAKECFKQVQQDDYEVSLVLGMIAFYSNQYSEALEYLYRAFNQRQNNYHLNQIFMFVLNKLKQKDKALEFAINIYKLQQFQNVYWLSFTIGQHLMSNLQFSKAHDILQKAADQFHFHAEKTYKLYHEKKLDNGDFSIPYFINQNDNLYLSDYPVFSSNFLVSQGMIILTEQYFQDEKYLKLFKLEMKLAELKKILGLQGSALKTLEKAELLLKSTSDVKVSSLDKYLTEKCDINSDKGRLILFTQKLNEIQIQSRWIGTYQTKQIDLHYSKLLVLHNFESAQLHLYGQSEYFSQERMIQGLLLAIHNFDDQEVQILIKSYLSFTFEIASTQLKKQLPFGTDGVKQLAQKYLALFEIIQPLIQLNVYANECLREFFYILGIYCDAQYFQQCLQYSENVITALCKIEIGNDFDVQEAFQHIRSLIAGQEKKQLIIKNNLQSLLLTRMRLNLNCHKHLQLGLSLFPKSDVLYCIAAQILRNPNFIIKSLECNPKCQPALYQLGLLYIGRENYDFAFQALQKCIEVEPTTSAFAYLALSVILLIYLQQNNNIDLPKNNKQQDTLQGFQNQLIATISSYLDYVAQLQNTPIQNILSIIYRNLYMGHTITSEAIIHDERFKQIVAQLPSQYLNLLYCEVPYIQKTEEADKIYAKFSTLTSLNEEISHSVKWLTDYETNDNSYLPWASKLKYLLHLTILSIDKVQNLKDLVNVTNQLFDVLVKNILSLRCATNIYNYDNLFMNFVNKWYHFTRTVYLKDHSNKDYYLFVAKFQQQCIKLSDLHEAQLINYIDILVDKNTHITQELKHKLQFMELIYQGQWKEATQQLQLCILHKPSNPTYRSILNKLQYTFNDQKHVQEEILSLKRVNQGTLWLNTLINLLVSDRAKPNSQLQLMNKIIKYKILPYADQLTAKLVLKILSDCNYDDLMNQISKQFNINCDKWLLQARIQKALHQKHDVNSLLNQFKVEYLNQYEDAALWRKTALFFIPILTQLFYDRGSNGLENTLSQAMSNCQYAQEQFPKDIKLKKARFIYNNLLYSCYLRKLNGPESGDALIQLHDISEEFLSQGTFNSTSSSLYLHYLASVEKFEELNNWLKTIEEYALNYDPIIEWGEVIKYYHESTGSKDLNKLKKFIRFVQELQIKNLKLQSLVHYLIGQAVLNYSGWEQKYSKEDVLKKFQVALLLNPNAEIMKELQSLQNVRQVKVKLRLRLDQQFDDIQIVQKKKKKIILDGLNSDSDELMVDQMDYEEDQKEFKQQHGLDQDTEIEQQQPEAFQYDPASAAYQQQMMQYYGQQQFAPEQEGEVIQQGYQSQYPEGYQQQYPEGYQQQYPEGYQQQYPEGYQQQYPEGYQEQYYEGEHEFNQEQFSQLSYEEQFAYLQQMGYTHEQIIEYFQQNQHQ